MLMPYTELCTVAIAILRFHKIKMMMVLAVSQHKNKYLRLKYADIPVTFFDRMIVAYLFIVAKHLTIAIAYLINSYRKRFSSLCSFRMLLYIFSC